MLIRILHCKFTKNYNAKKDFSPFVLFRKNLGKKSENVGKELVPFGSISALSRAKELIGVLNRFDAIICSMTPDKGRDIVRKLTVNSELKHSCNRNLL